jgi:hypothetical protein
MVALRKSTDYTLPIYHNFLLFTCATFFIVALLHFLPIDPFSTLSNVVTALIIAFQWIVQTSVRVHAVDALNHCA